MVTEKFANASSVLPAIRLVLALLQAVSGRTFGMVTITIRPLAVSAIYAFSVIELSATEMLERVSFSFRPKRIFARESFEAG